MNKRRASPNDVIGSAFIIKIDTGLGGSSFR
jgi:hypothetical protein